MKEKVFKIAMLHLEDFFCKKSAPKDDIDSIKKLVDCVKGNGGGEFPAIKSVADFYELAANLKLNKQNLPKVVMDILRNPNKLIPSGLIGDIGEFLGEKKGIGLIPTSVLNRAFIREELDKFMGSDKWEFFFQDEGTLKKFKENKGI